MSEEIQRPQINVSKIAVGGGIVGAIFALGSMAIFFIGIPLVRIMFPAAIVLGCGVALVLRFMRHNTPGAPWLRSAIERVPEAPSKSATNRNPRRSAKLLLDSPTTC